jgi:hypothetical protein
MILQEINSICTLSLHDIESKDHSLLAYQIIAYTKLWGCAMKKWEI